jgi:glycosyltransferase involved in cell wall biosynthesis
MKLSIIIPTYNVEEYIDECLRSLLPQLNDECELIIIDDFSQDQTVPKIIENLNYRFEEEENFKFYINTQNKGVSATRNVGLKVATGEYVAFVDGDDLVEPDYIKEIFKAMEKKKDYYQISWNSFGLVVTTYLAKHLPDWNCTIWARLWKRDIIKHEFDETLKKAEDKKFLADNITPELKMGYINQPIYRYRSGRAGSLSNET